MQEYSPTSLREYERCSDISALRQLNKPANYRGSCNRLSVVALVIASLLLCILSDDCSASPSAQPDIKGKEKKTLTSEMLNNLLKDLGHKKMLELTSNNKKPLPNGNLMETPVTQTPTIALDSEIWPKFDIYSLQEVWKELNAMTPAELPNYVQSVTVCCLYNVGQMYGGGHLSGPCCHRMMQVMFLQHLGRHTNNAINEAYREWVKNRPTGETKSDSKNIPHPVEKKVWEAITRRR